MNPVLRESLEVFFAEGHGLPVYFYLLIILAPVEFLALYLPSLDAQMWSGSGNLFKVCSSTAVLLIVYFALRVANQDAISWSEMFRPFQPERREMSARICGMTQCGRTISTVASHAMWNR